MQSWFRGGTVAVALGCGVWMTAMAVWADRIAVSSSSLERSGVGHAQLAAAADRLADSLIEVDDMVQAKWEWNSAEEGEPVALVPIVITKTDGMTWTEFRAAVREARAETPPYDPEGDEG